MSLPGRPASGFGSSGTAHDALDETIPARFARQAALHPARRVSGAGLWQPTYEELNLAADRLACRLLAHGGCSGDRIALLMRHATPLMAAVIAVLKAGRIVVVLNPTDPAPRLLEVLADAEASLILTDQANRQAALALGENKRAVVCCDDQSSDQSAAATEVGVGPDDVAFLIYTSGSTGHPKGVMQTHRNVVHNSFRTSRGMGLCGDDRLLLLASLSGGNGVAMLWSALLHGATLCLFPIMERGIAGLSKWLREHDITVFSSSASVFRHFIKSLENDERHPSVRLVRLGSEPVSSRDFAAFQKHFFAGTTLLHTLSSSETGNITELHLSGNERVDEGPLPVGRPVEGIELLLLDENGQEVVAGQSGQILVKSRYLSPGYWRSPELSAQSFGAPLEPGGARSYLSGDIGRRGFDGLLSVEGRKDTRVKIRGYRIEPSEVEAALLEQTGVQHAVVRVRAGADDAPQLVAFVSCQRGNKPSAATLARSLRSTLPLYMVPTAFVLADEFPLTPHGKIDHEKLEHMHPAAQVPELEQERMTETELLLARIWADVLDCGHVGPRDDFFELGGDSLTAVAVTGKLQAVLGVELDLGAFTKYPMLADFAALIDEVLGTTGARRLPRLLRASRKSPLPLSFEQERTWRYSQISDSSAGYTIACSHSIRGPLDVGAFIECVDYIARRHEILRTTFAKLDGGPVQVIHQHSPVCVPVIDLSQTLDPEAEATNFLRTEARRPFDLACLPLIRLWLVRIRENVHWLLRVNHHIISDTWSWKVYFRELKLLYEARVAGLEPPLSVFEPLQYCDYADWQRRALDRERPAFQMTLAWWQTLLAGEPRALEVPFKRDETLPDADPALGVIWWGLEPGCSKRLDEVQRGLGISYFAVRLAAVVAILSDETGQDDIVLGTYVSNRSRHEFQNMLGFFANLATLRLNCDRSTKFRDWAFAVRRIVSEARAHCQIPYEQLCEELRQQGLVPPEIRAIVSVTDQPAGVRFGGLELYRLERRIETMPWGFSLTFDRHNEDRRCRVDFDARIYDPDRVRAFIGRLIRFLDSVSSHPDLDVFELLSASRAPETLSVNRIEAVSERSNIERGPFMQSQTKRILVTGGSGFLGRHVLAELTERGYRHVSAPSHSRFDLTQPERIHALLEELEPQVVIHLAARVGGIGANRIYPGTYFYHNLTMGLQLIEACRLRDVERFLAVGTICSYPKHTPVPFREEDFWNGYPEETNAPYGLAKKMLAVQLQAYRQEFGFDGLNVMLTNLYGPGDNFDEQSSHVIPALIRKFTHAKEHGLNEVEIWGTGNATREFLYVTDAARAIVVAIDRLEESEPINVGTGREISIRDLASLVAEKIGFHGEIRFNSNQPDGQPRRCLDVTRAFNLLGFRAAVSLEQGLDRTIAWYRAQQVPFRRTA